jgi:hypothetical protein
MPDEATPTPASKDGYIKIGRMTIRLAPDGVPVLETDGPVRLDPMKASVLIQNAQIVMKAAPNLARLQ